MTDIRPFRGVRYDPKRVELSKVIVPPYDVISDAQRGTYYDRDPHNAIRFELTRDPRDQATTDYHEIREWLDAWRASGVLVRDDEPALYVMRQTFEHGGHRYSRTGFFAALALAEYGEGKVLRHERTLAKPIADRLRLLEAARANLSSAFLLYRDEAGELEELLAAALERAPLGRAVDDGGVEYEVGRLGGDDAARVCRFLASRSVVIADGHHRYQTALEYRNRRRAAGAAAGAPSEATLAFFANADAEGSLLLPIHRAIVEVPAPDDATWRERLPGWSCRSVRLEGAASIEAVLAAELAPHAGEAAFAADDGSGVLRVFTRAEPLGDALIVDVVERDVIRGVFGLGDTEIAGGGVEFFKQAEAAAAAVREGAVSVALYLNPVAVEDVFRVARAGGVMPQKSTFFHPKVPTGIVFRTHDPEDGA
ncbi:MAG: DUF1015 domain-containing protein [Myxococcota bacterium]